MKRNINYDLLYFIALLRFQFDSNRKPNPDTSEEDIEELKSIISYFDKIPINIDLFDEYYR